MLEVSAVDQVLSALESLTRTPQVRWDPDLDLFELGLLDSLGWVELLVFVDERFGIQLTPAELDRDDWATPRKILAFVEARLAI